MENKTLIIEQEFNAPVELVWRAITEKELMQKWYFDIPDFTLEIGGVFHFEGGTEEKIYVHICEMLEIIPCQKLKYSWKYEGYSGISFVTFELFSMGDKTKLRLTHEGIDSFPRDNPDLVKDNFIGGWRFLIHESLKNYLENGKTLKR
ncbi:MAG: SRPBCC domain-containing protein [Bacteroidota bacterium]